MTLEQAIIFAAAAHEGQTRKDNIGTTFIPYVVHPIEVMRRLYNYGIGDEGILVAALCHDILEDCENVSYADLVEAVGSRVANIVKELTFDKSSGLSKEAYLKTFATSSFEAIVIKMADRLCNVEDFARSKPDYALKYLRKADGVYAAFADRANEIAGYLGENVVLAIRHDLQAVAAKVRA